MKVSPIYRFWFHAFFSGFHCLRVGSAKHWIRDDVLWIHRVHFQFDYWKTHGVGGKTNSFHHGWAVESLLHDHNAIVDAEPKSAMDILFTLRTLGLGRWRVVASSKRYGNANYFLRVHQSNKLLILFQHSTERYFRTPRRPLTVTLCCGPPLDS